MSSVSTRRTTQSRSPYDSAIQADISADRSVVGPTGRSSNTNVSVPHVSLGAGRNIAGLLNIDDLRGNSKGYRGKQLPSNTFMQCTYMVTAFDKKHAASANNLTAGQLYFIAKTTKDMKVNRRNFLLNTVVSIGYLNQILYQAWNNVLMKYRARNGKAIRFMQLLGAVSEDAYVHYYKMQQNLAASSIPDIEQVDRSANKSAFDDNDGASNNLKELYKLCQEHQDYRLSTCPQAVLDEFKFGGVVLNYTTDSSMSGPVAFDHTDCYQVLNGIISGVAEVHDVFTPSTEMCVGSRLFLHVRRRQTGDSALPYGAFVVDPVCMSTLSKPKTAYAYRDLHGVLNSGLLEEIGQVHYQKDRMDSVLTQHRASGVEPTLDFDTIRKNTVQLAKITVALAKRK